MCCGDMSLKYSRKSRVIGARDGLQNIIRKVIGPQDEFMSPLLVRLSLLRRDGPSYQSGATPNDAYLFMFDQMAERLLMGINGRSAGDINQYTPFFTGPPGTGKTYFAEMLGSEVKSVLKNILFDGPLSDSERNNAESTLATIFGPKIASSYIHIVEKCGSGILDILRKGSDSKAMLESLILKIPDLIDNKNTIMRILEKEPISVVVVFPSQENATDFILRDAYIIGGDDVLKREVSYPIFESILKAHEGHIVYLVVDESTETLKNDSSKRVKNLHDFLDSLRDGKIVVSVNGNLDNESREILDRLKHMGVAKDALLGIEMDVPTTFSVVMTGNQRGLDSPVGFTQSTWERVSQFLFDYPSVDLINDYLRRRIDEYSLYPELNSEQKLALDSFGTELSRLYSRLMEQNSLVMPSLRTFDGILRAFVGYMLLRDTLSDTISGKMCEVYEQVDISSEGDSSKRSLGIDVTEKDIQLPTYAQMGGYLLTEMATISGFNIGDFQVVSEGVGSEQIEHRLSDIAMKEETIYQALPSNTAYLLEFGGGKYVYPAMYFYHLLYATSAILSGQKFVLFTGTTQEGKTTMAEKVIEHLVSDVVAKGNPEFRGVTVISFKDTNHEDHLTLEEPNVKTSDGEPLISPRLMDIIKSASENPEQLFLLVVNEIDSLPFTQGLNEVLTRNQVYVNGVRYDISNLSIIGTSNTSTQITDNFLSRSVLPIVMTREIANMKKDITDDLRTIVIIHEALKEHELSHKFSTTVSMTHDLMYYDVIHVLNSVFDIVDRSEKIGIQVDFDRILEENVKQFRKMRGL